jgi:hypothetical protein
MNKKIIISPEQLEKIVYETKKEVEENIFSDMYYGLKGVWRGYGYDFYKYTNQVDNIAKSMLRRTQGLDNSVNELYQISQKVGASRMPDNLKDQLRNEINNSNTAFQQYQQSLQNLRTWSQNTIS